MATPINVATTAPRCLVDPMSHKPLELDELIGHKGGMGIRLMRLATDELIADIDESGHNRLRLVKRFDSSEPDQTDIPS